MKFRKHKGFSLLEVVIGFVLLTFIVTMVGVAVTDSYVISSKLKDLPSTYYAVQDDAENKWDEINRNVQLKYSIMNELLNLPSGAADPSLQNRLNDIENYLSSIKIENVTLFGKQVEIYKYTSEYTSADDLSMMVNGGVINTRKLDRPLPIIDEVIIDKNGSASTTDLYDSEGATITAEVKYNSKNYSYYFTELYQWYVCTGNFHTAEYTDGPRYVDEELQYATVFTIYPNNFTLIPGAKEKTITIDKSYYGKFLVCVATPLSIEGAMGESVVSNYIYISALPQLTNGIYSMVIDASQIPVNYNASGEVALSNINSRYPTNSKLMYNSGISPKLNLAGESTDTDISTAVSSYGSYSRFIRLYSTTSMKAAGLNGSGKTVVYAVVKNNDISGGNFLFSEGESGGFLSHTYMSSGAGDTGWQIVEVTFSSCTSLEVGKHNVSIAELIVVRSPSDNDKTAIIKYLTDKYRIFS